MRNSRESLLLVVCFTLAMTDVAAISSPIGMRNLLSSNVRVQSKASLYPRSTQNFQYGSLNLKRTVENILTASASPSSHKQITFSATPISIVKDDMDALSAPRNSWLTLINTSSAIEMDIGVADDVNPQTWTLPANLLDLFTSFYNEDFIPLSEVPTELRFTDANKVIKSEFKDSEGNVIEVYDHYALGPNVVDYLGISYYYYLDEDMDAFDPENYKLSDVPLQLGDSFSYNEYAPQKEFRNLKYWENTKTVDAFGTLITPYGNFECLRISFFTTEYTRPDVNSTYSKGVSYRSVGFMTKQGHYFVGKNSSASGNSTINNIEFRVVAPTGILQDQTEVQVNNDGNGVLISNTGVYIDVLTKTADPNAILDLESDNKGILIPRLKEANRPATPNTGLLIYQLDNNPGFYYYDGTTWTRIANTTPASGARITTSNESSTSSNGLTEKGFGRLVNGSAFIPLSIDRGINTEELHIQLQAEGECNGLYISRKTKHGFEVKEIQNGKSNAKFSWTINQ